jgi:hypothetical protein
MKLLRVHVVSAATCGGLLDGFSVQLKSPLSDMVVFSPVCLVGPNGTGKSQFLQVIAEMFQSAFHACVPDQERREGNPELQFRLEYYVHSNDQDVPAHIRISREGAGNRRPELRIERREGEDWIACPVPSAETSSLLPAKVVGYTSGDNETLSLPFLISRGGYADEVGRRALEESQDPSGVPDTRLMLIDYGTHLEVLVANLDFA